LKGNRDLDRLFVVDTTTVKNATVALYRAIREIRSERFHVVVDLQGWIKSQLLCLLSGARSIVGLEKKNELGFHILRHGVPFRPEAHMVELFLDVARRLGAHEAQVSFDIPVFEADAAYIDAFLGSVTRESQMELAILQPGTTWTNKRWSVEKLAEVGRTLVQSGRYVAIVSWGPGEQDEAREVVRLIGDAGVLAPPTTIRQLAALLKRSRLYVGTDSGPMHLASALGVPTVGLFGPADPARFGPYQAPAKTVRRALPCSPCGVPFCRFKTVECMTSIDVPEVLDAIDLVTRRPVESF
jgi:ADP-heptose:LPS heptosyltransferase